MKVFSQQPQPQPQQPQQPTSANGQNASVEHQTAPSCPPQPQINPQNLGQFSLNSNAQSIQSPWIQPQQSLHYPHQSQPMQPPQHMQAQQLIQPQPQQYTQPQAQQLIQPQPQQYTQPQPQQHMQPQPQQHMQPQAQQPMQPQPQQHMQPQAQQPMQPQPQQHMQPQAQQPMQPQPQQHMQPQAQQPMQLQSQQHMQPQPQQPMQPQPQNVQNVQQEPLIHANANFFSAAQTNQHFKPGQVLSYSLSETNKSYLVESELPGQQIHALDISVRDQVLLINGERQPEQSTNQVQYLSNERYFGHFQRAIQIPGQIDVSKVTAKLAAGMLIIELPKHANNNENFRNIQVNLG